LAVVVSAVVFTVRVVVPLLPGVTVRVDGLRLQVGRCTAPVGEFVSAQLRFMVPEYVLPAVRVVVVVTLAPGITAAGAGTWIETAETVTVAVPMEPLYAPFPP
jgi:hypothetical protein